MNRGVATLVLLVGITLIGGVLTAGVGFGIPTIEQTSDPAGSFFMATPNQALLLVLWVGFVLVNVIGAGLTLAGVFYLLHGQVKVAEEMPTRAEREEAEGDSDEKPELEAATAA